MHAHHITSGYTHKFGKSRNMSQLACKSEPSVKLTENIPRRPTLLHVQAKTKKETHVYNEKTMQVWHTPHIYHASAAPLAP